MSLDYSNATRHAQNEGLIAFAGSGAKFNLYTSFKPANANTPITTQTLLVSMQIAGVFGTDVDGTLTLGAVTTTQAVATGTATFFRIFKSDGTTVVMDGTVGLSNADLILNIVDIIAAENVSISSGTLIRGN